LQPKFLFLWEVISGWVAEDLTRLYLFFKFMWPCVVTNFFVINPTRCTNFTNLFCHETLHLSDSSSVHHQEFIHCTLGTGISHTGLGTVFEQDQDGTAVPSWPCSAAVYYEPVWHIPFLSLQWINSWWWTEELSEACRVSWQNKFVKLVHLVGFIRKNDYTCSTSTFRRFR
jgi:hypothetical protein